MNIETIIKTAGVVIISLLLSGTTQAQVIGNPFKKKETTDTTQKENSGSILKKISDLSGSSGGQGLSSKEVAAGLKEALSQGVEKGTKSLSSIDGFLADAAVKILMPPEAKKVEESLRRMGLDKQVDNAITSMNRAAEDAAKSAAPIFINAIKGISIQDALGILRGSNDAATQYLKTNTTKALADAFRPVIESSLTKVDATKHWNTLFSTYNKISLKKVNPDLTEYVTEKALTGIFIKIAEEEENIRKNPTARASDLLKKVFSK